MKIWGFDPSSNCGFAIVDTDQHLSGTHCEVFENKEKWNHYWYAAKVGRWVVYNMKTYGKPDLAVIELGSMSSQGTGINGIIWCWACIGALLSTLGASRVPVVTISPPTWRGPFYGKGFEPPREPILLENGVQDRDKRGNLRWDNDWKAAAMQKCEREEIRLPPRKTTAHNAAEAVGIAHSWRYASAIDDESADALMALKKGWDEPKGRDLFSGEAA